MIQPIPLNISPKDLYDLLVDDSPKKPFLVDVREHKELAIASFTFSVLHLPLSQASSWMSDLGDLLPNDQSIVVSCHAGVRSLNFATWLLEQGISNPVWNLEGGIAAWRKEVDQSIPRF